MRNRLVNNKFTIISNNCVGGKMYNSLGLKFTSPTINLFFFMPDYIQFLENLDYYLATQFNFKNTSTHTNDKINYPIGVYNDGVEIHFMHYHTKNEALQKWNERTKRMNKNNLFIIGSDRDNCNYDIVKRFDKLNFKNKIFFSSKKLPQINSAIYIDKYKNEACVGDMIPNQEWLEYFDLIKWLNTGKIKKYCVKKYVIRIRRKISKLIR